MARAAFDLKRTTRGFSPILQAIFRSTVVLAEVHSWSLRELEVFAHVDHVFVVVVPLKSLDGLRF